MLAILNFLKAHNLPIFQPFLMILVSKFMVLRALPDKTYLPLGLLSPFSLIQFTQNHFSSKKQIYLYFYTPKLWIENLTAHIYVKMLFNVTSAWAEKTNKLEK